MGGILDSLGKLFGVTGKELTSFLGSDAFGNMAKLGGTLYQGNKLGDMMDFQKGIANQQMAMSQEAFDMNKEDRDKAQSLDWTAGY